MGKKLYEEMAALFNLVIDIDTTKKTFTDDIAGRAIDDIEIHGCAIKTAKAIFCGEWHVLVDGTLMRGVVAGCDKYQSAIIDISENVVAIMQINECQSGRRKYDGSGIFAHELAEYISFDGERFYLPSIKRAYNFDQSIKKICNQ